MKRLQELEQKLSLLMINTEESFVLVDLELRIAAFNEKFKNLYLRFYNKEVIKGDSILDYASPERLELVKTIYQKVFSGETEESEISVNFPNEPPQTFLLKYKPAYDEKAKIIGAFVSSIDITERKKIENQLKQSEERFSLFMRHTPALAWITDQDGFLVYANQAFLKAQQFNQDILNKNIFDIFPEKIASSMHANNLEVIQSNRNIERIELTTNPNGDTHYYSVYKFPISNYSGKTYVGGLAVDSTTKIQAEEKVKQNEERLRTIIDNEPECVKVVDKQGNLLDMNSAGLRMIEADTLDQVKGKKVIGIVHKDDRKKYLDTHEQACNGNKGIARFRIIGLKSTQRWMEMHCVPLQNSKGEIYAALSVTRDITEQIIAEQEKEFERKDKEALINTTQDAMWSLDQNFRLIAANHSFISSLEKIIGKTLRPGDDLLLRGYFPDEFISFWETLYKKALLGKAFKQEVFFQNLAHTSNAWSEISFNPIFDGEKITGIACYGRNITENKKNEQELIKLNNQIKKKVEELALSNSELEQFAYITSHDLQEPLRMVSSFLTLLEKKYKDQLDEKANQYIHFAVDGALRMRQIILDLLEYSRAGKKENEFKKVDMNELLKEIIQLNKTTIEEKQAQIYFENLPEIYAYKTPLLQVLQNLIGNALKYQDLNKKPIISIESSETDLFWEFAIIDNGIGIEAEFHEKIFVLFQRLHPREKYSGTGMGLAICKKIIENHGGKIWVTSTPKEGSIFRFTIRKDLESGNSIKENKCNQFTFY
jgi:PAS domain S-box-containing protein